MKYWVSAVLIILSLLSCGAQNLITVSQNGKLYDEANSKYITLNQDNEDVNVIPGMVFSSTERTPGWYKIEYSPGLHAYIPEQITSNNYLSPAPGKYAVANNPKETVEISQSGDNWECKSGSTTLKGKEIENIIIFTDTNNQPSYSLVDIGTGPIVISYDNQLTKFF